MSARSILWAVAFIVIAFPVRAETVDVKYRGPVDLKTFTCTDTVSSFVNVRGSRSAEVFIKKPMSVAFLRGYPGGGEYLP